MYLTMLNRKLTKNLIPCVMVIGSLCLATACAGTTISRSTGQVVDDVAITSKVKAGLLADPITDGLDIEIETYRGTVQLNGIADSNAEMTRAEEIASGVSDVQRVANNLIVRDSRRAGEYIDDKVLQARVNAAFAKDSVVRAISIDVDAYRGIVMLGGFVKSDSIRQKAEVIARNIAGVGEVRNNLLLR